MLFEKNSIPNGESEAKDCWCCVGCVCSDPAFFIDSMKRERDDGLAEQIEALKVEIEALKGEKVKWEAKGEAAEEAGDKDDKAYFRKQLVSVQQQLASVQNRLDRKEAILAEESKLKREKAVASGTIFSFCVSETLHCSIDI